ncbi:2Fe-2S iron-sulfur cluster-binding protein [Actinoplanes sp. L3-i22]|uniref:2Fe-2S iron-sulfur cluster-binding protein n=1 Tax=Actinoplanes sp. L3-i22 TaxID=2836373 RepID=UPI001C7979CB|nr:2Fe-2S iron-sulfur cluster-binding protein [Actinoplanes sp. L3-i22]BCY10787.1 hypothetical protein L3i22_058750 [Actinoplanes sp. L3-i22]
MSWEYSSLTTVAEIEAAVGRPSSLIDLKQIDRLDDGCVTVLANSPIAGFGYLDAHGDRQATFVSGKPAVHSPRHLSVDVAEEITGGVSFVFLLPGVGETLRLNGTAAGRDNGRLRVDVDEAYVHCARCIMRSQLWQPPARAARRAPQDLIGNGPLDGPGVRDFLAAMPFFVVTSGDAEGGSDTSPRGDRPGFVRILDAETIAIPDRKGNRRADTLRNLLQDDRIALAALRPGRDQILRLRGTATITDDPGLLATMALRGMPPHAALLIRVEAAEVSASPAVAAARLWQVSTHVAGHAVPDLNVLAARHAAANAARAGNRPLRLLSKALTLLARPMSRVLGAELRSQIRKEGYDQGSGRAATASREMTIADVRPETPDAVTIVLVDTTDPGRPIDFRPGQFFTVVTEIDGRPVRRAYSASSAPGADRLEITVKRTAGGLFSTHATEVLRPGDRLTVRGPSGTFRPGPGGDLVLVAAGSGVTPMMSVIRSALAVPGDSRLALLCGNRDETSVLFAAELDRLRREHPVRLSVMHRLTRPGPEWTGGRGRLDPDAVQAWLDTTTAGPRDHYLLCGPEPVMRTVHDVLTGRGVPADRIHRESYTSAADTPAGPATGPHRMTVEDDGHPVAAVTVRPGETLLSAGLAAGVPMPYSCTVGNCGECVVRLRAGSVVMGEPNCLTPAQRADGYVLTCVGRPTSAVTADIADPA